MTPILELRWEITPANCFEEEFTIDFGDCQISIQREAISATISQSSLVRDPLRRGEIEEYVRNLVRGIQLQSHEACLLSGPRVASVDAEGRRAYIIECETGRFFLRGGKVDIKYTTSSGQIVDTKLERIKQKRLFSQISAEIAPTDVVLQRVLRSINAAVRDPEDELIHLYEIREAINERLGANVKTLLGITKKQWSRFGEICNDLPLTQGRHRGRLLSTLRAASDDELSEARKFISYLVEAYLKYVVSPERRSKMMNYKP